MAASHAHWWTRPVLFGLSVPLVYLVPLFVCFYVYWGSVVVELGHAPVTYRDPPAGIDGFRRVFNLLFRWSPLVAAASVLLAGGAATLSTADILKRDSRRAFLLAVLLSSAAFGLAFVWVFLVDPFQAFDWHFD